MQLRQDSGAWVDLFNPEYRWWAQLSPKSLRMLRMLSISSLCIHRRHRASTLQYVM